jgi:hypothetical protein
LIHELPVGFVGRIEIESDNVSHFVDEQRIFRHARDFVLRLAESYLAGSLFRQILGRIERLAWHPT